MGAFQTGFGMGQSAWNFSQTQKDRELDRERQKVLDDDRLATSALQQEAARAQLDESKRLRQDRDALKAAFTEATVTEGIGVDGGKEQPMLVSNPDNAGDVKDFVANTLGYAEPETKPATWVNEPGGTKKLFDVGGLEKAKAYQDSLNDPIAQNKRYAQTLRAQGRPDEAVKYEVGAKEMEAKLYDISRDLVFKAGVAAAPKGAQAVVDALYKGYDDGRSGVVVQSATGDGGVVNVMEGDQVVSSIPYKNMDDLLEQARGLLYPDKVLAEKRAAAAELAKEQRTQEGKISLERVKAGMRSVRGGNWVQSESGEWIQLPGGSGGRGGAGGGQSTGEIAYDPLQTFNVTEATKNAHLQASKAAEAAGLAGKPWTEKDYASAYQNHFNALKETHIATDVANQRSRALHQEARKAVTPEQKAALRARALESKFTEAELKAVGLAEAKPEQAWAATRPLLQEPMQKLKAMARKPQGVSSEEARLAQEEIDKRSSEDSMQAF